MLPFSLPGFEIQQIQQIETTVIIQARALSPTAACPRCQRVSQRVHSYYTRSPRDLPVSGQAVHLVLQVRRFRCQNRQCQQQTFVEQLPEVVARSARQTIRLDTTVTLFAVGLSGEVGSRLLSQIGIVVSPDTLLRVAKRVPFHTVKAPRVLGVDDFAFRRSQTYGTILVNLETHRPIDMLPDRTADTFSHWLKEHPGVEVISRDRSSEYARGASTGAPQAQQIVDRWHVLNNLREMVQRIVSRTHATLKQRQKASGAVIRSRYKKRRSSSEVAASQVSRMQKLARYEEVIESYQQGKGINAIAQLLQMSPKTVRKFVYAEAFPERSVHKRRQNYRLAPYLPYLQQRVKEGCENASLLWQEIHQQGFSSSYKVVNTWLREYLGKPGRRSSEREKATQNAFLDAVQNAHNLPPQDEEARTLLDAHVEQNGPLVDPIGSPRHLTWLLVRHPERLNQQEHMMLAFIREVHDIDITYQLAQRFFMMVKERHADQFDLWLEDALRSGIPDLQTFAEGLKREYAALKAALTLPYSNGPVEGNVNKLKYIKRSMYGRGSFELLRQRVLQAA
jgi:transposase